MKWFRSLPKAARVGATTLAGALVLATAIGVAAPVAIRGRRFGRLVEALLPPTQGKVHVGGGRWSWSALLGLLRGRPAAVWLEDVQILDPQGTEVLYARALAGRLELHRAPVRIRVTDLHLVDGRWRFARMQGRSDTGFLAAWASGVAGARTAGSARTGASGVALSLADVHLDGLDVTFDLPGWALHLRDVHGVGGLDLGPGRSFTFDVSGAEVRGGGDVRIDRLAPVPFRIARLDRVTTTRAAPDAIHLQASSVDIGGSQVDFASTFDGIYGVSRASAQPTVEAHLRARATAGLINAFSAGRTGWRATGSEGTLTLRLAGPLRALTVQGEARGTDLANGGLQARDVGFDLTAEPAAGRFAIRSFRLQSPAGGHVVGELTLVGPRLEGDLTFAVFATAPFVPEPLRPFGAGTLNGRLRGRIDLAADTFALDLATLVLRREAVDGPKEVALLAGPRRRTTAHARGPSLQLTGLHVADGALEVPRLALSVFGAELVAKGRLRLWDTAQGGWLAAPEIALDIGASRVDLERLTGLGFARGSLSFTARLRGSARALTLSLRFPEGSHLRVLDEPFALPRQTTLHLDGAGIALDGLRLDGPRGSVVSTAGRIAFAGSLALQVSIARFPLDRLPGFSRSELPISGLVSAEAHLAGDAEAPTVRGQVSFDPVTFQDRPVGGGTIEITPGPRGAIRARGHLIDTIALEGTLTPQRGGVAGEATVTLEHVRLDPLLPELPGGIGATGMLSGRLIARVAPKHPVTAEGRLSELALLITPPGGPRGRARPVELHAEGEIPLAARSGPAPVISIGPARFAGTAGAFELRGERRGETALATLRGRIQLAPLAPLFTRWVSRLTGALDVDLATSVDHPITSASAPAAAKVDVRGSLTVAAPVELRLADLPVEARVTSGVVHVAPGAAGRGELRARVAIDALDLLVRELGPSPIHVARGWLDLQRRGGGELQVTNVDLPLRGELRQLSLPPVFVERGRFEARVSGNPARALTLAGVVSLDAARLRTNAGGLSVGTGPTALGRQHALERLKLDLRLRAPDGAVTVDVPNAPDVTVGLDMHVSGTAAKPTLSGEPHGSTLYSRVALALWRLFR